MNSTAPGPGTLNTYSRPRYMSRSGTTDETMRQSTSFQSRTLQSSSTTMTQR